MDPQPVDVRLRFPQGYAVGGVPDGGRDDGRVATYRTEGVETSAIFEIEARP